MSRDALIVGINIYQSEQLPNLKSPANDAEAIAQLLSLYGDSNVRRLPDMKVTAAHTPFARKVSPIKPLTLTQLEYALKQLFKPNGANIPETALFYFAGHGLRRTNMVEEGYLATNDTDPLVGNWGLSLQRLRRLLQDSPIKQQIIWLDCCHSGELFNFEEADPGERGKGLDRCFIAAAREYESAYEETSGKHGVLTGALVQGLDPSSHPDGMVDNYILTDFIHQTLKGVPQRPLCNNSGGKILFTGKSVEVINPALGGTCPYKGLQFFDFNAEDPKYFYGRTALTDELLEKVRSGNFLAVLGVSGSGKSSVVRAGLLHQLKLGQRLSGSEQWQIYYPFTPAANNKTPLENLARIFVPPKLSLFDYASESL